MVKYIALDDGHGMQTSGKRTPILPKGLKSETGNFMHENEFNRAVVKYLKIELERCGFKTLLVAPNDNDTPLEQRTNLANSKKVDLYLSIHANANTGSFGSWGGIETFCFPSGESKRIANIIHKHLLGGSPLADRKVKDGSHLWVIRKTSMPSVLLELGFMDGHNDYKYLLSDSYRRECAREIAAGVCEAFGVKHKAETTEVVAAKKQEKVNLVSEYYNHDSAGQKKVEDFLKSKGFYHQTYPLTVALKTGWFAPDNEGLKELEAFMKSKGWTYEIVPDRVGIKTGWYYEGSEGLEEVEKFFKNNKLGYKKEKA